MNFIPKLDNYLNKKKIKKIKFTNLKLDHNFQLG